MSKQVGRKLSILAVLLLLLQLVSPAVNALAETNSSMLPPSNLAAQMVTPDDVKLTWSTVHGATGYNVYEIKEGQLVLLGKTTAASYSLNNMAEGSYRYVVSTLSADGESGPSAPLTVEVVYPEMAAPTAVTQTVKNGNDIVLSWGASAYTEKYNVYQISEDGRKTLVTSTTARTYTVTNAPEGKYTYAVSASNSLYGESVLSDSVQAEIIHPVMTAPANFTYTVANGNDVTFKWDAVPYATNYKLYQIVDGQAVLKSTSAAATVKLTNVPAGDFVYEIRSNSDRFGESAEGSRASLTVEGVALEAPGNAAHVIKNGNDIVLSWSSAVNATSYKVYQIVDGQKVLKSTVAGTSATYTNMPAGDYVYEIHSYSDRFGESLEGGTVSFTLEAIAMTAPGQFSSSVKNGNDIALTWESVPYATSYKVYQVSATGQKTLKSNVTGTAVTYANQPEGDYKYEVYSYSTRFGESVEGSSLSLSLVHPEMAAPANLKETIKSNTSFTLAWDTVDYATSYKVYQISGDQKVLKSNTASTSATYSNMPAGEYTYVVYASSSRFGDSAEGSTVAFTLNGETMTAPTNVTHTILNGNDIRLSWTGTNYATGYKIYQIINGEKVLKNTITGTAIAYSNMPAGDYQYVVHSYSTTHGESTEGAAISISLVHPIMKSPENVTHKFLNGNDLAFYWNASTYATSYKLYEVIDGEKVLKATVSSLSASIPKVTFGNHVYEIHSVSSRFGESAEGTRVSVDMNEIIMPAPENVTSSTVNGNDVILRWNATTYATAYKVYQVKNGERELVRTVTGTAASFVNAAEGDYTYEIHSYSDRFGESPEGSEISLTIVFPVMQAPANATSSIANGNDIVLRWNASTYATAYNVYQVKNGQKEFVKTVAGTVLSLPNMTEGDYTYEVHSYSSRFDESPEGSTIKLTLTWPVVQPPSLSGTVFNANNITLTWKTVPWANEYRVYQITNSERKLIYKGTALTQKVYNLTEDTHSFEVTAYNTRFGESVPSEKVTERIVYPVMQSPAATLTLTSETSARIVWDFVTYANGYNIYELINGKPVLVAEKVNNLSYTVSNLSYANHEYYVTSYSNSFGESEPSNAVLAKLIVDTEAPVTKAEAPAGWTNQKAEITLSATDNETGVAGTYYAVNGSEYTAGTSLAVEEEGVHNISFYSVDKVGNKEAVQTIAVKIDKTAPVTKTEEPNTWSKENVTVKLTASDEASGVEQTFYSVNGSEYAEGTSLTIEKEGISTVSYYSVDKAGNKENVQAVEVKVDKTAPVTKADAPDTWSKEDVTVKLVASDEASGVEQTFYSINGSDYTEGTTFTVEKEGINKVSFYSVDKAGNKEAVQTVEVKVDKTAPVTESDASDNWLKEDTVVQLTATDKASGTAKTYYSIDGSEYAQGTSFTISKEGVTNVSFYTVDQAGNAEEAKTIEVKVDKTTPVISWNLSEEYALGTSLNLTYKAEDVKSGIAAESLMLNGQAYKNGDAVTLSQPGTYEVVVTVTDKAGWTTTIKKTLVVYIPASIDVNPGIIKQNSGVITVQVTVPKGFNPAQFDLGSAKLSGVSANTGTNGLEQQAKKGQFKFNREDFTWNPGTVKAEFRGMLNGYLVVGSKNVEVK
ncbi:OmpL47-type beta-barrel domain-containing protein [Domibacillus iocasae]|uniref:Fibronectin type-III domain-containing protein n=1 Tax=Domibacillus iocasae TaxID=1714016 RepID=A0A1E7DSK7_9BACI|nr:hypothetical protein [Domibacillus iocasae]OES46073.1 hypothetical protein BA724_15910 [Domibacillus iocasae]